MLESPTSFSKPAIFSIANRRLLAQSMASLSSPSPENDGFVVLECVDPQPTEADREEIVISTAEINSWDLTSILCHEKITIKANCNRLVECSSYFRGLLSGSFSESGLTCILIRWNLESFLILLKFIFGCAVELSSSSFLPLYEAALYFGVEMLLSKCKIWLTEVTTSKACCSVQVKLDDMIQIWKFSVNHANDFIPELFVSYLARNFMWAKSCYSFIDIPYDLLLSCIKHPHLTVDSEKHLCEAVLAWTAANIEHSESLSSEVDYYSDILKQVRISLLPLCFAAGKRRCSYFYRLADKSINAILSLVGHPSTSSMDVFVEDDDLCHLRIRFTEYTKKLDLSDCPQMKPIILLLSTLPCSYNINTMMGELFKQPVSSLEHPDGKRFWILRGSWPTLTFEAVQEVDISNCPMLDLETAIECFCKSFPSLRILKAAYFSNFKTGKLYQLVQRCPLLCSLDLTVDVSPIIPMHVSVLSSCPTVLPKTPIGFSSPVNSPSDAAGYFMSKPQLSCIVELTLEGRTDISDSDLRSISEFCVYLKHINLKGCISVTDAGISFLIQKCTKLCSIVACYTSFGQNSVLALCSAIPNSDHDAAIQIGKKHSQSLAYDIQTLHMGGCKGISETSLTDLMSRTQTLRSVCLRETNLVDTALYSFLGSSLEMLDVSDTMVSGTALAYIVSRNPGLKCLKARGCRNLFQWGSNDEGKEFPTSFYKCKDLYTKLGTSCKFEELSFGWGFSCFSVEALKPAITKLRKITVGLGGSLGQEGLKLLPTTCPLLESLILYFQVISDPVTKHIMESLRHLQELALCYCLGEMSSLSFKFSMPNLKTLKLERVTPWMTHDDLLVLTQNCKNLIELSLLGCTLLNPESQGIISSGWPGLISIHLEECGGVTEEGITSLFDCHALEDLLVRHNGCGIQQNFVVEAALKLPMLRKVSLDLCDGRDGEFDLPKDTQRHFLRWVKIAKCKLQKHTKKSIHKETLVLVWDSKYLTRTLIKERV